MRLDAWMVQGAQLSGIANKVKMGRAFKTRPFSLCQLFIWLSGRRSYAWGKRQTDCMQCEIFLTPYVRDAGLCIE